MTEGKEKRAHKRISISRIITTIMLYIMLFVIVILVIYPLSFTVSSAFSDSNSLSGLSVLPFTHSVKVDTIDAIALGENAYALPDVEKLPTDKAIYVVIPQTNTGSATLAIGDNAALPLRMKAKDGTLSEPAEGKLKEGRIAGITFNGTELVVEKTYTNATLPTYMAFGGFSLIQFKKLFEDTNYKYWFFNTFKIACANTVISVLCTTVAAYIFSRFRFRGKKPMLMSMLILQMFPSFAGMIATYVLIWRLGLLDNLFGLILVYSAGSIPYNTWLIKGYLDTIPRSLDEAARVDGAGYFRTFRTIILPIARPMVTFLAVTSFTGPWMDFILPRLLLKSDVNKTLAIGLFEMINGRENNYFTQFAAGAVLVAIPFIIIFAINQQYMTQVLSSGAVKE
ncbi:MAG: sugar ABC transporter permease [Eubacteriales bacterium]|nr:sugar ABC transporter permease [Eubacteriales bacterium]MDD3882053.1 sugar ABC transporter permease [Eubacteriales bacterium]MDD4512500.1 sugar ABC transporter permease [Eubacteriales bacterium]